MSLAQKQSDLQPCSNRPFGCHITVVAPGKDVGPTKTSLVLWAIGFSVFWIGVRLDEEVLLIVAAIVGSAFILWGLVSAPMAIQLVIEISLIVALFSVCMTCVKRGLK